MIYTAKKIKRVFSDDQFKLQELQTRFRCSLVCFAMVQVMLSLWALFVEFLGSYSRCKMTNGVMPHVMGATNFYLKLWVNILTIRMLLCSSSECWCSSEIHLGSSYMNEHLSFWIYHMGFVWFSGQYPLVLAFPCTSECFWIKLDKVAPNLHWIVCRRESSGSAIFRLMLLWDMQDIVQYHISYVSICDWSGHIFFFALPFNFSPIVLFTIWSMCRAEHSDHQNVPFVFT